MDQELLRPGQRIVSQWSNERSIFSKFRNIKTLHEEESYTKAVFSVGFLGVISCDMIGIALIRLSSNSGHLWFGMSLFCQILIRDHPELLKIQFGTVLIWVLTWLRFNQVLTRDSSNPTKFQFVTTSNSKLGQLRFDGFLTPKRSDLSPLLVRNCSNSRQFW